MDLGSRNAQDLAAAFLSADWTAADLERTALAALGARAAPKWLRLLGVFGLMARRRRRAWPAGSRTRRPSRTGERREDGVS